MGSQRQHKGKADRCQQFADSIDEPTFPDWTAIVLFYKALHLVEMMLAAKGEHTTTHNERRDVLKKRYPEILRAYKPLYNYSLLCRYRFLPIRQQDLDPIRKNLAQLEEYVRLEIDEG